MQARHGRIHGWPRLCLDDEEWKDPRMARALAPNRWELTEKRGERERERETERQRERERVCVKRDTEILMKKCRRAGHGLGRVWGARMRDHRKEREIRVNGDVWFWEQKCRQRPTKRGYICDVKPEVQEETKKAAIYGSTPSQSRPSCGFPLYSPPTFRANSVSYLVLRTPNATLFISPLSVNLNNDTHLTIPWISTGKNCIYY